MEDVKEKLLCAIRNNILFLKPIGRHYSIINKNITLTLFKESTYTEKTVYYRKNWWSLNKTKKVVYDDLPCKKYFVTNGHFTFSITEEEFNEILNLREEKIIENQLLELDKLCNTKM